MRIKDETQWNDPENELVIAGGPIGGITAYPGSGKLTAVTISPLTQLDYRQQFRRLFWPLSQVRRLGRAGSAGQGQEDVVIVIDGDRGIVTIEAAPLEAVDTHLANRQLMEIYAKDERELRGISVITAGQAAEHVPMCGLNVSYYDPQPQGSAHQAGGARRVRAGFAG